MRSELRLAKVSHQRVASQFLGPKDHVNTILCLFVLGALVKGAL